jgi:hypothetical protein
MGCNTPDYRYQEQPVNVTGGTIDIDGVGVTAFGELAIAELTPNIQLQFPYTTLHDGLTHLLLVRVL